MRKSDDVLKGIILAGGAVLVGMPLFVGLMVALGALHAWVLSKLWTWFVTPIFGIETPALPLLFGLSLIVSLMTHQTQPNCTKDKDKENLHNLGVFASPFFTLLVGYLCKTWFL